MKSQEQVQAQVARNLLKRARVFVEQDILIKNLISETLFKAKYYDSKEAVLLQELDAFLGDPITTRMDCTYPMSEMEFEEWLKPALTDEFLKTLVDAGRVCGWMVDYSEVTAFIDRCYRIAEKQSPDLTPFEIKEEDEKSQENATTLTKSDWIGEWPKEWDKDSDEKFPLRMSEETEEAIRRLPDPWIKEEDEKPQS